MSAHKCILTTPTSDWEQFSHQHIKDRISKLHGNVIRNNVVADIWIDVWVLSLCPCVFIDCLSRKLKWLTWWVLILLRITYNQNLKYCLIKLKDAVFNEQRIYTDIIMFH